MKQYKICVVGDVGTGEPVFNGQTAKTRDYIYYLKLRYGEDKVQFVDTRYWKKKLISKSVSLIKSFFNSDVLLLSLGANGRKLILPFVVICRPIFKYKVLFSIVGGSLMYNFDSEPNTVKYLKRTDANFVETKLFETFLLKKGIDNVYYSPVFSKRKSISDLYVLQKSISKPYKFCTYSRVCKEKGTNEAIEAIKAINRKSKGLICELDIYGTPLEEYKEEFYELICDAGDYIHVHPYLDDTNAIDTLSEHYMMLFPTYYEGEGFPIAIIECLKSGVPVIASNWHFNSEVVIDGMTGKIFELNESGALERQIEWAIDHPDIILNMKQACLEHAKLFEPDQALNSIYQKIEG